MTALSDHSDHRYRDYHPRGADIREILPSVFDYDKSYYRPKFGHPKEPYDTYSYQHSHYEAPQYREIDNHHHHQPLNIPDPYQSYHGVTETPETPYRVYLSTPKPYFQKNSHDVFA